MNKENPEEQPEKDFDENAYHTIKIGKEEEQKSPLKEENFVKTLLNLLDSGNVEDKDSALDLLKKENAVDYLIQAIKETANTEKKAVLLAACWETGLSFKGHHTFFVEYALHPNPLVSLEAITVLDTNREGFTKEEAEAIIAQLNPAIEKNHDNAALLEDLKLALFEQFKEG